MLDVLVDLRIGSPVYGIPFTFNLDANDFSMLFIPKGVAHGFYVFSDRAIMAYKTSTVHSLEYDTGILWNSFDIWPTDNPILSDRDKKFSLLDDFESPFVF